MFYVTQKNWDKILGYAEEAYETEKSEIGGMSVMVEDGAGDWELQSPVILKQEISSGNTVLEKAALSVYYSAIGKKMGKKNFRICWWHSHHTMAAFWSGTDKTAIDEFNEGDFSFALVINLKEEYKFRVSMWKPFEIHEDIDLEIVDAKPRCTKKMEEEVKELCNKPTYTPSTDGYSWRKEGDVWKGRYGYKSSDQLLKDAAEDPRQGQLPFHSQKTPLSGEPRGFSDVVDEVDDFNSELIDGTITYKVYAEAIDALNAELATEDSMYKVNLIREDQKNDLLHILPAQLVVYNTGDDIDGMYGYGQGWGL